MEIRIYVDDRIVNALRRLKAIATRRRVAALLGGVSVCSVAAVVAAPLGTRNVFTPDSTIYASEVNDNFDELFTAMNEHVIRVNTEIAVTSCAQLEEELLDLSEKHVLSGVVVTLRLALGTHLCSGPLELSDGDWGRVTIAGAGATDETTLQFPSQSDGFVLTRAKLGGIEDLTIDSPDTGGAWGVLAFRGSSVELTRVHATGFAMGVGANEAGIVSTSFVETSSNEISGFRALNHSYLNLADATASSNGSMGGVWIADGSSAAVHRCTLDGNSGYGLEVGNGSEAYVTETTASNNTLGGYHASGNSTVELYNCTSVLGSGTYDIAADSRGSVRLAGTFTPASPVYSTTFGQLNTTSGAWIGR